MSTNRVYLRSDSNTPSTASSKRPRANEDRDTSSPRVKVKRTDSCGLQVSNIVPSNASAEPAVTQVTTNAQVPANADFLTPGAHTESNDRNNAAVRSVPQNSNPSTPGSSTRPFSDDRLALRSITAGNNSDAGRPLSLNRDPSTPGPYVTSYDKPAIARADQPTTSAAQTMSQDFKSMSHQTTTHEDDGSAARNVQKWNEGRGPNTTRNVYGEPSESSLALESDRDSQPSVATPLANSTSAALSNDLSRWMPTPFKLVELGHTNQRCPRVEVSPESELSKFLDVGLHPVASAIAGIHIYGHENPVPQEATQVLRMFYDIYRSGCNSPHVTFLDPLLYRSGSYPQAQLETFRKKEWAWLVHVGRLISFPGILCESWELVTIRPDYQQLEIALVLSNDNRLMTYLPDRTDPPPGLDTMELYESPPGALSSPCPSLPHQAWQDIAFCYRWIPAFKADDICAVIKYKYQIALAPHHLDEIARATFNCTQPLDCTYPLVWASRLNESEKAAHRTSIMEIRIQASRPRCTRVSLVRW